jgi:hypothetical protein
MSNHGPPPVDPRGGPPSSGERGALAEELDALFVELIEHQRRRVLAEAQRREPSLTEDDVAQPHDHPALAEDAAWHYEDGVLAGYRAAQMAVRARLRR